MAGTEEEEDLLLDQHRAFVPGDDREAAEATPYWADAVALLEKHKRARAVGASLSAVSAASSASWYRRSLRSEVAREQWISIVTVESGTSSRWPR